MTEPETPTEPALVGKVLALHRAFEAAGVIHAFGGALALAYWTADPRATADIDVNVSLPASAARRNARRDIGVGSGEAGSVGGQKSAF